MAATDGDRIIHVDMSDQSVSVKDFPVEWQLLGGRALSAKIMHAECDPSCDPLGPDNVLVMAPGALSGTTAPTSGRISMGGKSPLTNGIKEANAGGNPGQHLMKLGYRAIVVKGQPKDRAALYGMRITGDGIEVVAADDCKGMWNYALCDKILASEHKNASAITIGPAASRCSRGHRLRAPTRTKSAALRVTPPAVDSAQ